jgi:hypothetical protein
MLQLHTRSLWHVSSQSIRPNMLQLHTRSLWHVSSQSIRPNMLSSTHAACGTCHRLKSIRPTLHFTQLATTSRITVSITSCTHVLPFPPLPHTMHSHVFEQSTAGGDRSQRQPVVVPHRRRRAGKEPSTNPTLVSTEDDADGACVTSSASSPLTGDRSAAADGWVAPGKAVVHVKTWGCGHNNSDGEYMSGLLSEYGYTLTDEEADADLWVLNSCAVKGPSEDTFNNAVARGRATGKKVVLAGCVPQGAPSGRVCKDESVVGVLQIDRVVEVVEETLKGGVVRLMGGKREDGGKRAGGARLDLPKIRRNPLVEVVPISTGCLNQCTYVDARLPHTHNDHTRAVATLHASLQHCAHHCNAQHAL